MSRPLPPAEVSTRRSGDALRLAHGLHLRFGHDAEAHTRALAWQHVLPASAAFTGLTAAQLLGWWLPPLPDDLPVFLAMPGTSGRVRRPEVRCLRHSGGVRVETQGGLRLTSPSDTLLACAKDLGVLDVVVLVDAARRLGGHSVDDLAARIGRGRPGSATLRAALNLSDHRAHSPWETLLRVLHVVCEVDVDPQVRLYDETGRLLGQSDLHLRGTRTVIHEYDGAVHRDAAQHRKDLRRDRRMGRNAVTRRGYTSVEVLRRPVEILRDMDQALGREHDPRRLDAWYRLLRASLFTPSGTAAARRRWRLPVSPESPR